MQMPSIVARKIILLASLASLARRWHKNDQLSVRKNNYFFTGGVSST